MRRGLVDIAARVRCERGLSLVELMVSIVIGLVLVGGAISLLVTSKQTYVVQEDMARLQESGRFAMEMIGRDVRLAGYVGCASVLDAVRPWARVEEPGELADFSQPIEGIEAGGASWQPSGFSAGTLDPDPFSDAITVRHVGGPFAPLTADVSAASGFPPIDNGELQLRDGEVVALSDCTSTHIFALGDGTAFGKIYAGGALQPARLSRATAVRYFVAPSSESPQENSLWRQALSDTPGDRDPDPVELLTGVNRLEIRYGVDLDADGSADDFREGDAAIMSAADWERVVAVRIALLLRTTGDRQPETNVQNPVDPVNGGNMFLNGPPAGERARYRVVHSTFYLRNQPG